MIYYKIQNLFVKSGKSYRDLAKGIGLSYMTIFKIAHAKSSRDYDIGCRAIDKICKYFKCQPSDLLMFKN